MERIRNRAARVLGFAKAEPVFCVALVAALLSMIAVPPSAAYAGYIKWRTLGLLLSFMLCVAGLQKAGLFDWLAKVLLSAVSRGRRTEAAAGVAAAAGAKTTTGEASGPASEAVATVGDATDCASSSIASAAPAAPAASAAPDPAFAAPGSAAGPTPASPVPATSAVFASAASAAPAVPVANAVTAFASPTAPAAPNTRAAVAVLVALPYLCAMFITNDVSLLTFVPFAILFLERQGRRDLVPIVLTLQTIAANAGSYLTPFGNPHNLYTFTLFDVPAREFVAANAPFTLLCGVGLAICVALFVRNGRMAACAAASGPSEAPCSDVAGVPASVPAAPVAAAAGSAFAAAPVAAAAGSAFAAAPGFSDVETPGIAGVSEAPCSDVAAPSSLETPVEIGRRAALVASAGGAESVNDAAVPYAVAAGALGKAEVGAAVLGKPVAADAPADAAPWRARVDTALYLALFVLSVAAVLKAVPLAASLAVVVVAVAVRDRRLFAKVDWLLLGTFVCFFVFSSNLAAIPAVSDALTAAMSGHPFWITMGASQVISNVPACTLLAPFTDDWRALAVGANIGGLGSPVGSLASLITIGFYRRFCNGEGSRDAAAATGEGAVEGAAFAASVPAPSFGRFMGVFLAFNVAFLAANCVLWVLLG